MAILKIKEIRAMSIEQMDEKLSELDADLSKMKSQKRSGGAPENTGKMRIMRKTIARIETIRNEKSRAAVIGSLKERKAEEKNERAQIAQSERVEKPAKPAKKVEEKARKHPTKPAEAAPKKAKQKK